MIGGGINTAPAINGLTLVTGAGGILGGLIVVAGTIAYPDLFCTGSVSLSSGSMTCGGTTGTYSVAAGGRIEANNCVVNTVIMNGGSITGTATTAAPGANGGMTVIGNLVFTSISMNFGSSASSTTLANSTTNTLSVFGTTTPRPTASVSLPTISMVGSSTTALGGSGSGVTGFTFYGRVSGKVLLTVHGGTASGGTVGRCGGIRFYGGCDIASGSIGLLETGSAGSTAPANNGTNGGLRFSGWCSIYSISIRPFNAAREADMTFVCENYATGSAGSTLGQLNVGTFSYTHGDGSAAPATFVFRGNAGAAISGAEAVTEPNTRHTYFCNSGTALTYKVQGAPV